MEHDLSITYMGTGSINEPSKVVIHKVKTPPMSNESRIVIYSSDYPQIFKNKDLSDPTNSIVASSFRAGTKILSIPEIPKRDKDDDQFALITGQGNELSWIKQNSHDSESTLRGIDKMISDMNKRIDFMNTNYGIKIQELEAKNRDLIESMNKIKDILGAGLLVENTDLEGKILSRSSIRSVLDASNPRVSTVGKEIILNGPVSDILGALIEAVNKIESKKQDK